MFSDCTSLTEITIPDSVTSIGSGAFSGCTSLTEITIPAGVTSIGGGMFSGCTSLTKITIPDSVTSIGSGAFSRTGLTEITIPANVKSIGDYAFDCGGDYFSNNGYSPLILITLKRWESTLSGNDRITTIGSYPFGRNENDSYNNFQPNTNLRIVVPEGSLSVYKAANWDLASRIEEESDE